MHPDVAKLLNTMDDARPKATYQDVLDAPEHMVAELIGGELFLQSRPRAPHAVTHSVLGGELNMAFQRGRGGPGGWWILDEPELHLGEDVLVPDVAGWRRERMPRVEDVAYFELVPDWVCEILSPGTARKDRLLKMRRYLAAGASYAWLVDPNARTIEAYRAQDGAWVLMGTFGDEPTCRIAPFESLELILDELFVQR